MNIKQRAHIVFGCIFFALGLFGYYMPAFPGTIFMIMAAYCFMNSSDRLYRKVVDNSFYGEPVRQYVENHIIPFKSKVLILFSMWIATSITLYATPEMRLPVGLNIADIDLILNFKVLCFLLSCIGTIVVLRAKNN